MAPIGVDSDEENKGKIPFISGVAVLAVPAGGQPNRFFGEHWSGRKQAFGRVGNGTHLVLELGEELMGVMRVFFLVPFQVYLGLEESRKGKVRSQGLIDRSFRVRKFHFRGFLQTKGQSSWVASLRPSFIRPSHPSKSGQGDRAGSIHIRRKKTSLDDPLAFPAQPKKTPELTLLHYALLLSLLPTTGHFLPLLHRDASRAS